MIETLYRTKTPQALTGIEQYLELTIGEQVIQGHPGYFVRETQCWWDAANQRTVRVQYTLSPRGGFASLEEARQRYALQRTTGAQRGFVHSFAPRYETTGRCKYERIEICTREMTTADSP